LGASGFDFVGKLRAAKEPRQRADEFYASPEWRAIRYGALKANDGRCELCGVGKRDGAVLHVDHIKPRSKFPDLALDIGNLQVMCEDCNLGKSNKCTRDWRRLPEPSFERRILTDK